MEVKGDIDLIQTDVTCSGVEFINCSFDGLLAFNNLSILLGVKLTNCEITRNLIFFQVNITGFDRLFNFDNASIQINNSKIGEILSINRCNLERGIEVKHKTDTNGLTILTTTIKNGGIYFQESTVDTNCDIGHCNVPLEIRFHECTINSKVRFEDNHTSGLAFTKSKFTKDIHLWGGQTKNITFNDGVYEDDVYIKAVKASGILTIKGDEFKTDLLVEYTDTTNNISGGCDQIYLHSCSFGNGLFLIGSREVAEPYAISTISINSTERLKGELLFRNFKVNKLELSGVNANANIKLIHLNATIIKIDEFTNSSKVQFFHVKATEDTKSVFEIIHSNLGEFEFYSIPFVSFKKVFIRDSVVSDIITSNVKWFEKGQLNPAPDLPNVAPERLWSNNREVFRQLKFAMGKQGDRVQALEFKSNEMSAFRDELKTHALSSKTAANKIILWLGQSNNHGTNWIKPALLIVGFTILFYWLIVVSISNKLLFSPAKTGSDWKTSWEEFKYYSSAIPKMLNPVFIFDKTFKGVEARNFTTSFWEFFHRITLAYLLFQLVSAFRKFVK